MSDARVGRVLVASLHQAIGDVLPTRLGFYEHWLHAEGLREGTIGLAPLSAVLSFLRQEGDAYNRVTAQAGTYAAEWTVASMPGLRRRLIGALPLFLRRKVLLELAGAVVQRSYEGSRFRAQVRRGTGRVEIRASVFCSVREPAAGPLCLYYAAVFSRMLSQFGVEAPVTVEACRGMGDRSCVLQVSFRPGEPAQPAEEP